MRPDPRAAAARLAATLTLFATRLHLADPIGAAARWIRRRLNPTRGTRDAGLTSVEIAILTAVLLGLATALAAAISVVVTRQTNRIQ